MRQTLAIVTIFAAVAVGGIVHAAPIGFNAIEGPYASVADYCARLGVIKGTCSDESVAMPLPEAQGPLRAIRFIRVRASESWHMNRRMLVLETPKGLYVDERLDADFDRGDAGNDSAVTAVVAKLLDGNRVRLFITLHGTGTKGDNEALMCLVDSAGIAACRDPGVHYSP